MHESYSDNSDSSHGDEEDLFAHAYIAIPLVSIQPDIDGSSLLINLELLPPVFKSGSTHLNDPVVTV